MVIEMDLNVDVLQKFRNEFYSDSKNVLAQNVCSTIDPIDVAVKKSAVQERCHIYTHKVESEGKPVCHQKSTGRCWIFASLNAIRLPFMKEFNIEEFEFSQGFLFLWDKIERCNYFLNNVANILSLGEPIEERLMSFLLHEPISDGGQWDMFVSLVTKYGLMPKCCFTESFSCEQSGHVNMIVNSKLREYTKEIKELVDNSSGESEIKKHIQRMMDELFRIIGICLGIPPETFVWEYYDKNKQYKKIGPISPTEFYEQHVKKLYNVQDKICLVNDPRPNHGYGKLYTVEYLGNIVGARHILYNNQSVELLMELSAKSIKNGEAVWFGCDVGKRFVGKQGLEDIGCHDFKLLFGVDVHMGLGKADRLLYGASKMNHAMIITGVSLEENEEPTKWRVENSWGESHGEKGYLMMTREWFAEFVYEIVVDKSLLPEDVVQVFKQDPIVLPAWDPMGALAR